MAKQKEVIGDFNFGFENIQKATEVFSKDTEKKSDKTYQLNFKTHKDWVIRFHAAHMNFLLADVDYELFGSLKDFFKLTVNDYTVYLEEKNQLKSAPKNFIHHISKRGRRTQIGDRTVDAKNRKSIVFGEYNVEEQLKEKLYDLMYSLAVLEEQVNFPQYTISYFFYDILLWTEQNLEQIAKKYKS